MASDKEHQDGGWAQRFETATGVPPLENTTTVHDDEEYYSVPPGYWFSYQFIGSAVAIVLLANSLFIGYAMPVSFMTQLSP